MTQVEDISCVCLQETKIDDSIDAIETHIKGYREYRANRIGKGGGGTSIHVKDNIAVSKHKSFSNSYCEANLVQIKELNCNLICFYRPPNTTTYAFAEALETINEWIENDKEDLVIVGDFNFKEMSCWEEKEINGLREKATKKEAENRGSLLI